MGREACLGYWVVSIMNKNEKKIDVKGPVGNLEAIVSIPAESQKPLVFIMCHPNSQQGGSMNNKVVTTLCKVANQIGAIAIRFNFRSVGESAGEFGNGAGEQEDLHAIIAWAKANYPENRLALGGFSFGSYVATAVASQVKPEFLVTVAPPVSHYDFMKIQPREFPWVLLQGDQDDVVEMKDVLQWYERIEHKPELLIFEGAGHFFHGRLIELRDRVQEVLQSFF